MNLDANTIINILTPLFATLFTAGVKWLTPRMPSWVLPFLCTIVGTVGNMAAHYLDANQQNIALAVGLSLAGIGLREMKDQWGKATAPAPTPPAAKP